VLLITIVQDFWCTFKADISIMEMYQIPPCFWNIIFSVYRRQRISKNRIKPRIRLRVMKMVWVQFYVLPLSSYSVFYNTNPHIYVNVIIISWNGERCDKVRRNSRKNSGDRQSSSMIDFREFITPNFHGTFIIGTSFAFFQIGY